MKKSILKIHGQRFTGSSETCFKILSLMQELTPLECVYDFDAEESDARVIFYKTDLDCVQSASDEVFFYNDQASAIEARDLAVAQRESTEEAA